MKKPVRIIDIADMPNFNPVVKNRIHSVSEGKVSWTDNNYVTCREHGACLCVSKDRKIWRCPTCNEGAYVEWVAPIGKCVVDDKSCTGEDYFCHITQKTLTKYKNHKCSQFLFNGEKHNE